MYFMWWNVNKIIPMNNLMWISLDWKCFVLSMTLVLTIYFLLWWYFIIITIFLTMKPEGFMHSIRLILDIKSWIKASNYQTTFKGFLKPVIDILNWSPKSAPISIALMKYIYIFFFCNLTTFDMSTMYSYLLV